jgi:iron-sulfur cluster assembly accessory protein
MITLTPSAVKHLRLLLKDKQVSGNEGLRLKVEQGGCAGMQYVMKIDSAGDNDKVVAQDGVCLMIDSESLPFVDQSQIDYVDDLTDSGFKVINPQAARSCGCGSSFEPLSK